MFELLTPEGWAALAQIIMIDVVLAGDNAIVIGLAVAGLPADQRARAIFWGIAAATGLRIAFTVVATQLLSVFGLLLAGGVLLLWVCWRMWRELRTSYADEETAVEGETAASTASNAPRKTFRQAATQIIIADVSMSLDNVLAVAGAAEGHHWSLLAFGLVLSIALMAFAASFIAKLLHRYHWIAYVGLAVILYVALEMTLKGLIQVYPPVENYVPAFLHSESETAEPVEEVDAPALPGGVEAPSTQ